MSDARVAFITDGVDDVVVHINHFTLEDGATLVAGLLLQLV